MHFYERKEELQMLGVTEEDEMEADDPRWWPLKEAA